MTDRQTEVDKRRVRMAQVKQDLPELWAVENEDYLLSLLDEALTCDELMFKANLFAVDKVLNRVVPIDDETSRKRQLEVNKRRARMAQVKRDLPERWVMDVKEDGVDINEDHMLSLLNEALTTYPFRYLANLHAVDKVLDRLEEPLDYGALRKRQEEADKRKARIEQVKRDFPPWNYDHLLGLLDKALGSDSDCELWLGAIDYSLDHIETPISEEEARETRGRIKKREEEERERKAIRRLRDFEAHEAQQQRAYEAQRRAYRAQIRAKLRAETKRKRHAIRKAIRQEVWSRDGGRCVECGSDQDLHIDHIIPLSRGGSDTLENLQILCARCNLSKGNRRIG